MRVLLVFGVIIFFPLSSFSEELIKKGELLTLNKCIEIALKKQPTVMAASSNVNAYQSKIGQAQANFYPQIQLQADYSRTWSGNGSISRGSSGSLSSENPYNQYSASASLSQLIFDFGKTSTQVDVQRYYFDASRADLETSIDDTIFNVKQAYYSVLKARKNRDVSKEVVKQYELHLDQAKGFFEAGTRPKFDVTKAEVDLSKARFTLITTEVSIKLAVVTLNNAMGVPDAPEYTVEASFSFEKYLLPFEQAIEEAFRKRPELQSITAQRQAAESTVSLKKKDYFPYIYGNAAYGWSGQDFPLEDNWTFGVTLTFPLFSGFSTTYQVEEAKANLETLRAKEEATRQAIFKALKEAYLNLQSAEERIQTTSLAVRQAEENLSIAQGRYTAGVGNPIEVTDAETSYSTAQYAYNESLYDYIIAKITVDRAIGIR